MTHDELSEYLEPIEELLQELFFDLSDGDDDVARTMSCRVVDSLLATIDDKFEVEE